MTTTKYRTFDEMTEDAEWAGYGYIGGRRYWLEGEDANPAVVAKGDAEVLAHAEANGWTDADLFAWGNSKPGRWFADALDNDEYRNANRAALLSLDGLR